MTKLMIHFKKWNRWRKLNLNSRTHKLLVLLKLTNSPTLDCMICNDLNNNKKHTN